MEYININVGRSMLLNTKCAKKDYNRVTKVSVQKPAKIHISRCPNKTMSFIIFSFLNLVIL
jgi:hypothetical protein